MATTHTVANLEDIILPGRTVQMVHTTNSNNSLSVLATWVVYKEDGSVLNTVGSTTQGLQEALNYAAANGFNFQCIGGQITTAVPAGSFNGTTTAAIKATTTITIPPMQLGQVLIKDVDLNSSAAIGIHVDSALGSVIDLFWGGQIVMTSTTAIGVIFSPQIAVPSRSSFGIGISDSQVRVGSIIMPNTGTSVAAQFDRGASGALGVIASGNNFVFAEVSGGAQGIVVSDGTNIFSDNTIQAYNVHGQSSIGIRVGQTAGGVTRILGNKWFFDVHLIAGGTGVDTWEGRGYYCGSVNEGAFVGTVGLKLEADADGCIFDMPVLTVAALPVQDNSTSRGNRINSHSDHVEADLNNVNPAAIASATATKLALGTVRQNTNSTFSAGRWTPVIPGLVKIEAQAFWTSGVDQTTVRTMIYKNNVNVAEGITTCSGTGIVGALVSRTLTCDNNTDFFEIYVQQNTGGNLTVSGATIDTWASFTRLH